MEELSIGQVLASCLHADNKTFYRRKQPSSPPVYLWERTHQPTVLSAGWGNVIPTQMYLHNPAFLNVIELAQHPIRVSYTNQVEQNLYLDLSSKYPRPYNNRSWSWSDTGCTRIVYMQMQSGKAD